MKEERTMAEIKSLGKIDIKIPLCVRIVVSER